jgi:hypothetical protein
MVHQNHEDEKNSIEFFAEPAPRGGGAEDSSVLPFKGPPHEQVIQSHRLVGDVLISRKR